jgi:hypothetical protein
MIGKDREARVAPQELLPSIPPRVQLGVGRRLGAEAQPVRLEGGVQDVEHHARLHDRAAVLEVDVLDFVAVLGPVDDDRGVRALARQAGAAAAGEDGRTVPGRDPDAAAASGVRRPGDDDTERDLRQFDASVE